MAKATTGGKKGGGKKTDARPFRERRRGGEARAIADLVPDVGRAAFRRFGFVQSSVVSRWKEIVGERYAVLSCPESIRFPVGKKSDGTLELVVASAFAPQMQHVVPEIIERVNRFFGYAAVAKIRIRQGDISAFAGSGPKGAPSLRTASRPAGDDVRDIADPELATLLGSLAEQLGEAEEESRSGDSKPLPKIS